MQPFPRSLPLADHPTVTLRILTPEDWPVEYDLAHVNDVPQWTMYPADMDEAAARLRATRNVERADAGTGIRYVVDEAGTALGTVGFGRGESGFELFYALKPEARGRGLVTDAVTVLAAWLHANGERRVWLSTLDGNTASENVARRTAFEPSCAGEHVDGRPLTLWRREG